MTSTQTRKLIEDAQSALRDLYGLIPVADRKRYAEDHMKTLEFALNASSLLIGHMIEIEILATMARRDWELTVKSAA